MRRFSPFLLVLLAAFASAQQGAGGYGQGGLGGGMGGGMGGGRGGGGENVATLKARPEDDEYGPLWSTRTAIVTPGDRVEYKFVVKAGETLFAGATSDAFDPALSVVDPSGKEIAKNDDREEGDQSPFVAVRFPTDGTYLLRVLGYKAASGGKFTLKTRTFRAVDAKLGSSTVELPPDVRPYAVPAFLRLAAKKGVVYDLREAVGLRNAAEREYVGLRRVVGPTGVGTSDLEAVPMPDGSTVFRALVDGDYYLEYEVGNSRRIATNFREVAVVRAPLAGEVPVTLGPGEAKLVEFPVQAGDLVRTTVDAKGATYLVTAPAGTQPVNEGGPDATVGNTPFWAFFRLRAESSDDVVRIFHGAGTARIALRSMAGAPVVATVRNSTTLPEWKAGETLKDALDIGQIRLYQIHSTKSELMKVFAKATAFQVRLDIYRMDGTPANTLIDRAARSAGDDLYFPEADAFLVRLSCDGYGGSGEYAMRRDELNPTAYALGQAVTIKLDGANFGLFAVDLEAGKRYQLTLEAGDLPTRVDLLDDEGQFLQSQSVGFDGVVVHYFVPTRAGRHRLWLRGAPGVRRFRLEPHVPPKVGG